jgi:NTE family protein
VFGAASEPCATRVPDDRVIPGDPERTGPHAIRGKCGSVEFLVGGASARQEDILATEPNIRRVAIACQGGGSHTAFTAGVLKRLLLKGREEHEIVALSGTSGGAVCALLAWYALLDGDGPEARARAAMLLDEFWEDNSAKSLHEKFVNDWTVWASQLQHFLVTPAASPYDTYFSVWGLDEFRKMLERRVDFGGIEVQPEGSYPMLLLGAVDVLSGEFKAFNSRHDAISAGMILASAAIPTLFRSVRLDGGTYWDGLFSQNPPIRELTDEGPDEIWVIQINPKAREDEPKTVAEIADRRNELSGNLSLHQEIQFIEKINELREKGTIQDAKYKNIMVRRIEMSRRLDTASKLNRDPHFIRDLVAHGEERAEEFLAALAFEDAWKAGDPDAVMGYFADDAELSSSAPFPDHGPCRGREEIRPFVLEHLAREVRVDTTKKQVAGNRVTWTVRASRGDPETRIEGIAEAEFRRGKIKAFELGSGTPAAT